MVVSHCLLNQNAVVNGLERSRGAFPITKYILDKGIGVLQLPCPELLALGSERKPMTYEEYANLPGFKKICEDILKPIFLQLEMYISNGYRYIGVIGINKSPSCSISSKMGVLMELYFKYCKENNFTQNYMEIPTWYDENNIGDLEEVFENFIKEI